MTSENRHSRILNRSDLFGTHRQPARIDHLVSDDGPDRGARVIRLVNGGGLEAELHPDRALDIGSVTVDGIPFAWLSPTGFASPGLAERSGHGWLRTFGGGLVSTCGMDAFGDPSTTPDGVEHPQHGRFGTTPARLVTADIVPDADGATTLVIEAEITQASVHGEHLVVRGRIETVVGSRSLRLTDVVTNRSDQQQPHMVLYHSNLGWPVLGPETTFTSDAVSVSAANAEAQASGQPWSTVTEPSPDAGSLVYLHRLPPDRWASTRAFNPTTGLALTVSGNTATLPHLHSWKVMRPSQYVMGIEPANSPTMTGRVDALASGTLPVLQPGESVRYELAFDFEVLDL